MQELLQGPGLSQSSSQASLLKKQFLKSWHLLKSRSWLSLCSESKGLF